MSAHQTRSTHYRKGSRPEEGEAHAADHGRRNFLYSLGAAGAGSFLFNKFRLNALAASPLSQALMAGDDERILVIIRLKGGNDGLNTLLPIHDMSRYHAARPTLGIAQSDAVRFSDEVYLHPGLRTLQGMWEDGAMHIVNNVGYAEQTLSHFVSSDVWASAEEDPGESTAGTLGAYLEDQYPNFLLDAPEAPPALQVSGSGNLLFQNSTNFNYAVATQNPAQLESIARTGQLHRLDNLPDCTFGEQLGYVRAVANTTFRYAGTLAQAYEMGRTTTDYGDDSLGRQLGLIARMLRGGLKTRLFLVELNGFDTHANQRDMHAARLEMLGNNVRSFFEDLQAGGLEDKVLAMTISEFGRRIRENGSGGTDHGSASPMMLFGKSLEGNGITGGRADLANPDRYGSVDYRVDFRNVYATVFKNWLCLPAENVQRMLKGNYAEHPGLNLVCQGVTATHSANQATLKMDAYWAGGDIAVSYELLRGNQAVTIQLFDAGGRLVGAPLRSRGLAGINNHRLPVPGNGFPSGIYVVSLQVGGQTYSRKVSIFH